MICLLVSVSCLSQGKAKKQKELNDSIATAQLTELKNGALLVRLRSYQKQLKVFEKRGDSVGLRNEKRKIRLKHLEIVNAFKVEYSFSKVYFFKSHNSSKVKAGELKNVVLNDSLEPVDFSSSNYYIADPYRIEFAKMNSSQNGISLMDKKLKQLDKPFPYYVRKRDGVFFLRRDMFQMVTVLQKNLDWYAKKYRVKTAQ